MRLGIRSFLVRLVVVAPIVLWVLSLGAVYVFGRWDAATHVDAIVVLGAAQYAGRPSPVLKARLDHAVGLWKKGYARWFVVTGGIGAGDTTSEAAVGGRYAIREGVPEEVILSETVGRSTDASLTGVASLLRERQLSTAILVSDPFHSLRVRILARHYGITAVTSPTRTSPISSSRTESLTYMLGESIKVPITLLYTMISG